MEMITWNWDQYQRTPTALEAMETTQGGQRYIVRVGDNGLWYATVGTQRIGFGYLDSHDAMRACSRSSRMYESDVRHVWEKMYQTCTHCQTTERAPMSARCDCCSKIICSDCAPSLSGAAQSSVS